MGEAVFSYRSLPHWGRGTASAVDRVLSLIVDLRCIFSLSFIPLEPYPARYARHLPHAGKALSVVILFPHMRVFALRLWGKRYSRIATFPMGEGLRYGICFSFICFHARPGAFASCHPTAPFSRVQGRFLAALEMTRGGRTVIRGRAFSLLAPPLFLQNAPIPLEKNALRITISH